MEVLVLIKLQSTDSEISEDDLPNTSDLPDETLGERIAALKDIIPPETRAKLSNVIARTSSATGSVVVWGGKALWVVTTSVLLLGLPYALVFGEEQMMMEQERQERAMTEGQSGMLGGAQGQGQAKAAL